MPCYPALALLVGCAMAGGVWIRPAQKLVSGIAAACAIAVAIILFQVWSLPTRGDISTALTQHPEAYTLSLGHMEDLTLASFAYLRLPLMLAGLAFIVGASAVWWRQPQFALAAMMLLFLHAARLAMVVFDPYLSSRPLAEALMKAPPGTLIEDNGYYTFSSVFFYANRDGLLLDGRKANLEYGSYSPDAPKVFINDSDFTQLWQQPDRYYLLVEGPSVPRIEKLAAKPTLHVVAQSGGKFLLTNHADSR